MKEKFKKLPINAEMFFYLKLFAKYRDDKNGCFITEIDGNAVICVIEDNKFYAKAYNKSISELITDDYFVEAMIIYKLSIDDHVTDIIHWYAEDNFSLETMPFTLLDIVNSEYE